MLKRAPRVAPRTANATADRAIDILMLFTEDHPVWSSAAISAHFGMPRTTTYRYLNSLRAYGLVVEDATRGFRLGMRALALARVAKLGLSVVDVALPEMNRLNAMFGETVHLNHRVERDIVLLQSLESRHAVRLT